MLTESKIKSKGKAKASSKDKTAKKKVQTSIKKKYEICCLIGSYTFAYTEILSDDVTGSFINPEIRPKTLGERVIKIFNDQRHHLGIVVLTDDADPEPDFEYVKDAGCLVSKYPLARSKAKTSTGMKVQILKMREMHPILT